MNDSNLIIDDETIAAYFEGSLSHQQMEVVEKSVEQDVNLQMLFDRYMGMICDIHESSSTNIRLHNKIHLHDKFIYRFSAIAAVVLLLIIGGAGSIWYSLRYNNMAVAEYGRKTNTDNTKLQMISPSKNITLHSIYEPLVFKWKTNIPDMKVIIYDSHNRNVFIQSCSQTCTCEIPQDIWLVNDVYHWQLMSSDQEEPLAEGYVQLVGK